MIVLLTIFTRIWTTKPKNRSVAGFCSDFSEVETNANDQEEMVPKDQMKTISVGEQRAGQSPNRKSYYCYHQSKYRPLNAVTPKHKNF